VVDHGLVESVLAASARRESPFHGETHWRCVAGTGLDVVDGTGVGDRELIFLFGLLHDTRRVNEHVDPGHGARAAEWTRELAADGTLVLEPGRLDVLCRAIELHTDGLVTDEPTVGACWDADRLHLPRVSIQPDPARFSTTVARGPEPLAAAARLRDAPPKWVDLLRRL
jgi:uncharacterized protein